MKTAWKSLPLALMGLAAGNVLADLPQAVPPSTGPASGDWLGFIKGYIKDGRLLIPLGLVLNSH